MSKLLRDPLFLAIVGGASLTALGVLALRLLI